MTDGPSIGNETPIPTHRELVALARDLTHDLAPGPGLDPVTGSMIDLAVHVSVTGLDARGTREAMDVAFEIGATVDQIQETLVLVSTLGVHSLFLGMTTLLESGTARGALPVSGDRSADPRAVIDVPPFSGRQWRAIDAQAPGTIAGLRHLPEEIRAGVAAYCALPWRGSALSTGAKELVSLALDAVPSHCYLPGFRVHLQSARDLGVQRNAILEAVVMAGRAPQQGGGIR